MTTATTPQTSPRETATDSRETLPWYLTFDIGGTKIASGFVQLPRETDDVFEAAEVVDAEHGEAIADIDVRDGVSVDPPMPRVCDVESTPTHPERGGADIVKRLIEITQARLQQAHDEGLDVVAIGMSSAGVIDSAHGVVTSSTDLIPGWAGMHVAEALTQACGLPVSMVNDVIGHGLGEANYGAARDYARVLSVGVGTGIGGAIIEHGYENAGSRGVAGHIGHIAHGLGKGVPCSCGTSCGHIEPVASGPGLGTLYNLMKSDDVAPVNNGKEVSDLAAAGDAFAQQVMRRSARALGEAVGGAANLIDPDAIVISGSVAKAGDVWWNALREGFADSAMALTRVTPLLDAELGDNAPLVGAAVAARHAHDALEREHAAHAQAHPATA